MLPNLCSLHCHALNLLLLYRCGLQSLGKVTTLSLETSERFEGKEEIVFAELRTTSSRRLRSLKFLHFWPKGLIYDRPEKLVPWISVFSEMCPSLEEWSGHLPSMSSALVSTGPLYC
jgi:hypothetical protein